MKAVIRVANNVVISKAEYEQLARLGIGVIWSDEARPDIPVTSTTRNLHEH